MIGQKVGGYRGIEKRSEKRPASALVLRATGTLLADRGIYAPHLAAESQASAMSELQEHRNQSHSLTQPQRPLAGVRREEALQAGGRRLFRQVGGAVPATVTLLKAGASSQPIITLHVQDMALGLGMVLDLRSHASWGLSPLPL